MLGGVGEQGEEGAGGGAVVVLSKPSVASSTSAVSVEQEKRQKLTVRKEKRKC